MVAAPGVGYSVTAPLVVILPILLETAASVNHRFPSGPAVMLMGPLSAVGIGYSVTAPPVVILPIRLPVSSVN